jgi:hypothetical protein
MTIGICRNGNFHIGWSVDTDKRWKKHRNALKRGKHPMRLMQADWNTHGSEAFVFEVLVVCSLTNWMLSNSPTSRGTLPELTIAGS